MYPYNGMSGLEDMNGMGMYGGPADLMWLMFTQNGEPGYYMMYQDMISDDKMDETLE